MSSVSSQVQVLGLYHSGEEGERGKKKRVSYTSFCHPGVHDHTAESLGDTSHASQSRSPYSRKAYLAAARTAVGATNRRQRIFHSWMFFRVMEVSCVFLSFFLNFQKYMDIVKCNPAVANECSHTVLSLSVETHSLIPQLLFFFLSQEEYQTRMMKGRRRGTRESL